MTEDDIDFFWVSVNTGQCLQNVSFDVLFRPITTGVALFSDGSFGKFMVKSILIESL